MSNFLLSTGTWNEKTRSVPALKFMEDYTRNVVDQRKFDQPASSLGHTAGFTLQKSTGETFEGADKAWSAVAQVYAPFSSQVHDPVFLIGWDAEPGYNMMGIANLWWNLAAPGDQPKVKDGSGKEWDGVTPAAFKFNYVEEGGEWKINRTEIYSGPSQAIVYMLKRGMLTGDQLMQM